MDYIHIDTKSNYSVTGSKQDRSHITYGDRKGPVKNSTFNHFGTVETCSLLLQEIIILSGSLMQRLVTTKHCSNIKYCRTSKDAVTLSYSRLVTLFGY